MKKIKTKENKAATTIQKAYRGHLDKKKNKAATTIQAAYRGYNARKKQTRKRSSN